MGGSAGGAVAGGAIVSTGLCSVTVVAPDLGLADAYATAAVAMGEPGLDWLARQPGISSAVVTADGRAFRSAGLPVAAPAAPRPLDAHA